MSVLKLITVLESGLNLSGERAVERRHEAVFLLGRGVLKSFYLIFSVFCNWVIYCILKCPKKTMNSCYVFKVCALPLVVCACRDV